MQIKFKIKSFIYYNGTTEITDKGCAGKVFPRVQRKKLWKNDVFS